MQLKLRGIRKRFGENEVLRGIDLTSAAARWSPCSGRTAPASRPSPGSSRASTSAEEGTVEIDGAPVTLNRPQDAMDAGIQVIYQEFRHNLFPQLTVAENLYTGDRSGRHGRVLEQAHPHGAGRRRAPHRARACRWTPPRWCRTSPSRSSRCSPSPRRSVSAPTCSSWTSRRPPWTRRSPRPCSPRCADCATRASPSSTSPTGSPRSSTSPTAWWCCGTASSPWRPCPPRAASARSSRPWSGGRWRTSIPRSRTAPTGSC